MKFIFAEPPDNGLSLVHGDPTAVENGARVIATNVRTGVSASILSAADGSFALQLAGMIGDTVSLGGTFGEVESTKSVSELYAPVAGTVVEINGDLVDAPERLNDDPYGDGWICVIEPDDQAQYDALLDAAAYLQLIGS